MEDLMQTVRDRVQSGGEKTRKDILVQLRDLSLSIESEDDTAQRLNYSYIQLVIVRIGVDLGLFALFSTEGGPSRTVDEVAQKTGADPILVGRLLRYLASFGYVKETGKHTFCGSRTSRALCSRGCHLGVLHHFDTVCPAVQALPPFLQETSYADPTDAGHTALQKAWKTDLTFFPWLKTRPAQFAAFNEYTVQNRQGMPTFLDVYPVRQRAAAGLDANRALFVDVGGGRGRQAIAFRERYPDLPGVVVVQDLPATADQAATTALQNRMRHGPSASANSAPAVQVVAHDFFEPQPVRGAKFYYLRNVLHDFADNACRAVLRQLRDAMAEDSILLLDDMVLPDQGVHWQAAQLDVIMMALLAGRERTLEQWQALLEGTGLEVREVHTYTDSLHDSVVEAVLSSGV
ncbi:hypothetical protein VTK73DRAFT_4026 [Phialemonium thermophilum]|uniref:O-methyltransferase domain-containing protein n=1 Tax=Phialemonium thermophilum TaxID=223376 RepID=A0ABR3WVP2_9PEZI